MGTPTIAMEYRPSGVGPTRVPIPNPAPQFRTILFALVSALPSLSETNLGMSGPITPRRDYQPALT